MADRQAKDHRLDRAVTVAVGVLLSSVIGLAVFIFQSQSAVTNERLARQAETQKENTDAVHELSTQLAVLAAKMEATAELATRLTQAREIMDAQGAALIRIDTRLDAIEAALDRRQP